MSRLTLPTAPPSRYKKEEVSSNQMATSYFIDSLLQDICSVLAYIELSEIKPESDFDDISRYIELLKNTMNNVIETMDLLADNMELEVNTDERWRKLKTLLTAHHQTISRHLEPKSASTFRFTLYDFFNSNCDKIPKSIRDIPAIENIQELQEGLIQSLKNNTAQEIITLLNKTKVFSLNTRNQTYLNNPFEIIANREDFNPNEKTAIYSELVYHLMTNGQRNLILPQSAIDLLREDLESHTISISLLESLGQSKKARLSSRDKESNNANNAENIAHTNNSSSEDEWVTVNTEECTPQPLKLTYKESEQGINTCLQSITPYTREKERVLHRILVHFMRKPNGKSAIAFRLYVASTIGLKWRGAGNMLALNPQKGFMQEYSQGLSVSLFRLIDCYGPVTDILRPSKNHSESRDTSRMDIDQGAVMNNSSPK